MRNQIQDTLLLRILAATSMAAVTPAMAQTAAPTTTTQANTANTATNTDVTSLDEVVVTASTGDKTQLRSSLEVADISSQMVQDMAPRDIAETLRLIPGMSVTDQSGQGGNANFTVRGLPVTTGGSPFVQLQEDGLPQVLFGDMNFGNNDYWTRFDVSNTIEATIGGSASTLASGAPGAVINFISDTGAKSGGQATLSEALGFRESKVTFAVGEQLSDSWRFHMDGFYVNGTGPRDQGFIGDNGYQIKANLTHDLADDKGFIRLYVKLLDDQEEYNAGGPVKATGSGNSLSSLSLYPGFNVLNGTYTGIYNKYIDYVNSSTGQFGQTANDGIHPVVHSVGAELHLTPQGAGGLTIDDKFRVTSMSGTFASQFSGLGSTSSVIGSKVNGLTVGSFTYANGPLAGQAYSGLINNSAQIYTNMSDMGSAVNDLSLSDKFDLGASSKLSFKGGLFYMSQTIDQNWHPNDSWQQVNGVNPAALNLYATSGQLLTNSGISGYNSNWGGGNDRTYAMNVADTAPYLDLTFDLGGLQLEGGLRQDDYRVTGWAESASAATTNYGYLTGGTFSPTGTLNTPYVQYMTLDPNTREPLNYGIIGRSWSLGALYQFDNETSVYARASRGTKVNTDRNILSGYTNPDGTLTVSGKNQALDIVLQQELGVKHKGQFMGGNYDVAADYFHTSFGESSFDLTKPAASAFFNDAYAASGIEMHGNFRFSGFSLYGQITYQNPKVTSNAVGSSPTTLVSQGTGFLPGGMSKWTYAIAPAYTYGPVTGGVVIQGQTEQNIGGAVPFYSPGQTLVNLFASYTIIDGVSVGLHVNNLFNTLAVGGGGSPTATPTAVGVSAEPGRIILADVTVKF